MFVDFIRNAIEGIIVGIIFLPIVVVIHELGHLLSGKLSGYQFITLRLFLFQWARDKDGKIKFTKANSLFGVGGQCLMNPTGEEKDFRFKLYNLGGSLANIIAGILFIAPLFFIGNTFTRWLFIGGAVSIYVALATLIPMASGGLPNDGKNVKEASKSEDAKNGYYRMLKANGEMAFGKHLSEFDPDFFNYNEEVDVNNFFVAQAILLHAAYLDEKEDYKGSYQKLLLIEDAKVPSVYKSQILLALLFNELIHQSTDEALERAKERWEQAQDDKEIRSIVLTKHPGFMIPYAAKVAFIDHDPRGARELISEAEQHLPALQNPGIEHIAKLMIEQLKERLPVDEGREHSYPSEEIKIEEIPAENLQEAATEAPVESLQETIGSVAQEDLQEATEEVLAKIFPEITEEAPIEDITETTSEDKPKVNNNSYDLLMEQLRKRR